MRWKPVATEKVKDPWTLKPGPMIEVPVVVIKETDQSWLVVNGSHETWLAKKHCKILITNRGKPSSLLVPKWLVERENLTEAL